MRATLFWAAFAAVLAVALFGIPEMSLSERHAIQRVAEYRPPQPDQAGNQHGQNQTQPLPSPLPREAAGRDKAPEAGNCYDGEGPADCANRMLQERVATFTGWLVVVGVVQAIIYAAQSGFILQGLKTSDRAAKAAEDAANAAVASVADARKSSIDINRAYIGLAGVSANLSVNTANDQILGIEIHIAIRNAGETPAKKVAATMRGGHSKSPPDEKFDYRIASTKGWPELYSKEARPFHPVHIPANAWENLADEANPYYMWG